MASNDRPAVTEIDAQLMPVALGARMLVQADGWDPGFRTTLSGLERGRFLLLHLPRIQGITEQLYPDRKITARYIHEGNLYGFQSRVAASYVAPFRVLYLQYPKTIERLNLRHAQRVDCYIPAALELDHGVVPSYPAMVVNLSSGGCRLAMDSREQKLPGLEVDSMAHLRFKVVGTDVEVRALVRIKSLDTDGARMFLGLIFSDMPLDWRAAIQDYVDSVSGFLDFS
jgi:hypothetical protein